MYGATPQIFVGKQHTDGGMNGRRKGTPEGKFFDICSPFL